MNVQLPTSNEAFMLGNPHRSNSVILQPGSYLSR
nr:MAG TPA: hypothetical protein [Crassvirales sp.]